MKKGLWKTACMALAALIFLSCIQVVRAEASEAQMVYDITISDEDQQTVKGWGVFPAWNRADWTRNFTDKSGAHQALYEDLGVTMFRVMIPTVAGDGDGNLVTAKMREIADLIKTGEDRGVHEYIVSVWSPPVGMKTHPTVNGWTGSEHVRLRTDKEETYANYLVDALQWLIADGASVPKALSFQNEPLSMIMSEWCYWGGDNGQQYQRFSKLLRAKLDAAGLEEVQLLAPEGAAYRENKELFGEAFAALTMDPALDAAVDGFASHSYVWRGFTTTDMLREYKEAVDLFPDKDRWQTEYSSLISGVSELDMAIDVSRRLASDMAFIGNHYWFWWLGWDHARSPTTYGEVLLGGDGYTVTKSKAFHVLSKLFNQVPAGSKVRQVHVDPASGITTEEALWMDAVAFVDGNKTVSLIVNPTDGDKHVNVNGLTGSSMTVYQSTDATLEVNDMLVSSSRNVLGGTVSNVILPARSVSVLVTSDLDLAAPHITFDQQSSSSVTDAAYAVRDASFTVSGRLDEAGTLMINNAAVAVQSDLTFETVLQLASGDNTIIAEAVDAANNTSDPALLFIRHDPTYLGITVNQPALAYVNEAEFIVTGFTNDAATVTVRHHYDSNLLSEQSVPALLPPSATYADFVAELELEEGENTIEVFAVNQLNEQTQIAELQVIYDSEAPAITIPAAGTTSNGSYVVRGSVSEPAAVTINGRAVQVTSELTFATLVTMTEGLNTILVEATDLAGNTSAATVVVTSEPVQDGALVPGVAAAEKLEDSSAITIDGDLSESVWSLNHRVQKVLSGTTDNNVAFGTAWDDTHLYVGIQVLDVQLRNDSTRSYDDDSVEIYIDGNNMKTGTYSGDDHQIILGWQDATLAVGGDIEGIEFAQQNIENGYQVEMAIPWQGIGIDPPGAGAVIGFDVGNNDDDGGSEGFREAQLMWHGNLNNWSNTSAFGHLFLNDGRHVAVAEKPSGAINMDGQLNEGSWSRMNAIARAIEGTPQSEVAFAALSSEQYLYIGLQAEAVEWNETIADRMDIYIDPNIDLRGTNDEIIHHISLDWDRDVVSESTAAGVEYNRNVTSGGYTMELRIPWEALDIVATRDGTIGIDVVNTRTDGLGTHRLAWNGHADHALSTASYGNLLLHNASLPSRDDSREEPPGLKLFRDEGHDLSKIEEKSAHIINTSWEPEKFNGDANRIGHSNNNPATPEYVVYKSPYGDIFSFEILTGLFDNTPAFTFYGSADGITYSKINPESTIIMGQFGYSVYKSTSDRVGNGVRYLKIQFPGREAWKEQLLDVSFKYAGDPDYAEFVDEAVDLSKLHAHSGTIGIATYEPQKYGGDASRFQHSSNNPVEPEYIAYQSPDGEITTFDITTVLYQGTPPFTFYGSSDGVSYDPIAVTTTNIGGGSGFGVLKNTPAEALEGVRYLKIEYPGRENWHEHINRVSFTYRATMGEFVDEAEDLSKLHAHSGTISVASYEPQKYGNDSSRFQHSSNNPMTPEYLVYQSPVGVITAFDITTVLYQGTPPFTFYGSADGANYDPIAVTTTNIGGGSGFGVLKNVPAEALEGVRYLKIEYPGRENWKEHVNRVSFTYQEPSQGEQTFSADAALTGEAAAIAGREYEVVYRLENIVGKLVAQDLLLSYDPALFEYVGADVLRPGFQVIGQHDDTADAVRIILASQGAQHAMEDQGDLLRFRFLTRSVAASAASSIQITGNAAANLEGEEAALADIHFAVQVFVLDTSSLLSLIADAQVLHDESQGTGQYPETAREALQAAIDAAQAAAYYASSQEQIDQSRLVLVDAIASFLASEIVFLPEDLNRDGQITVGDLAIIIAIYGLTSDAANWAENSFADLNNDGIIDVNDLILIAHAMLN